MPGKAVATGVARFSVGAALVVLLLWRSNASAVLDTIKTADTTDVILGVLAVLTSVVVGAFRWRPFLEELDLSLPVWPAIQLTLVGSFFNAFLPTGFGGDAYKAFRFRGEPGALSRAGASVLLDRWAGMVGLAVLGLIGSGLLLATGDRSEPAAVAAALAAGILVASFGVLMLGPRLLRRLQAPEGATGFKANLTLLARAIVRTGRHPRAATTGLALGLVSAIFLLLSQVFLASALKIGTPTGALAGILLIAAVITVAPITVNGLGLREAVYVWALGALGVGHNDALAFGLLVLGTFLAASAVGGVFYLLGGKNLRPATPSTTER